VSSWFFIISPKGAIINFQRKPFAEYIYCGTKSIPLWLPFYIMKPHPQKSFTLLLCDQITREREREGVN